MSKPRSPHTFKAALRRQAVLVGVCVALVVATLISVFYTVPAAGVVLGLTLLAVGVLRLSLPAKFLGALAIRSKPIDVLICVGGAAALIFLALTAPNLSVADI